MNASSYFGRWARYKVKTFDIFGAKAHD